jgi:hypothetical protein
MTAGQGTRRMSNVSLAPAPLAALLATTLLAGAVLGATITLQANSTDTSAATGHGAAQPAATFDIAEFRAGERAPSVTTPETTPESLLPERDDRERVGGP